jgi:hypothetical protein
MRTGKPAWLPDLTGSALPVGAMTLAERSDILCPSVGKPPMV